MNHITFYSFDEFFEYFQLPKQCTIRLNSEQTAYFEFHPYKRDSTIIRGWIEEFNHNEVRVSFKYYEFSLGITIWSIDMAKEFISKVEYYYED